MKYIIDTNEFEPYFKVDSIGVFGIGKSLAYKDEDHSWSRIKSVEEFEELNSDYINEHYGDLQDTAYQRGINDGKQLGVGAAELREKLEYQRGLEDAWEAARKISLMLPDEIEKVFPGAAKYNRYNLGYSGVEAIAKLKAYEEQNTVDKIEVGDEVNWIGDCFIVTRIFQPHNMKEQCDGIDDDGCVYHDVLMDDLEKTGRHFDIASILKEIQS